MAKLVKAGAVVVDRREERRLRRYLDEIGGGYIEGALAADADIGLGRRDQRFGRGDEVALGADRRAGKEMVRQTIALRDVEDGEALEERDGFRLVAVLAGARQFIPRHEAVGVADTRAALALADIAAQIQRLAKGEPMLMGEALLDDRAPQDQDIDPGIAPAVAAFSGRPKPALTRPTAAPKAPALAPARR